VTFPLGVVSIVFGNAAVTDAAARAAALGFDHLDVLGDVEEAALPLAVGDRIDLTPRPGYTTPAAPARDGAWERMVEAFRRCPGARLEPWEGSVVGSVDACRALLEEVPGLRLTVDTGHVAAWGGDPVELLPWADHVQLRQASAGRNQVHPDGGGDVDVAAVVAELRRIDYRGLLSVEYFDLPTMGWPLDDPLGHAVALAERVRPLL
jgi:sugar phosphate isomerase/epimerase